MPEFNFGSLNTSIDYQRDYLYNFIIDLQQGTSSAGLVYIPFSTEVTEKGNYTLTLLYDLLLYTHIGLIFFSALQCFLPDVSTLYHLQSFVNLHVYA